MDYTMATPTGFTQMEVIRTRIDETLMLVRNVVAALSTNLLVRNGTNLASNNNNANDPTTNANIDEDNFGGDFVLKLAVLGLKL
ncbi:hypothetical protein Patl1_25774 [Pistacia atlantica]|uniref:Uncharacterized protein n=1 Tax=Pistacia atlantica TaxID=434234 RepID=A0ACC1AZ02_9ROSI|nr:hypothetical protein Patl1_25774 [Pistacia atlantica]